MALDKAMKDRLSKIDQIREELAKAEESASKDIMNILKEMMQSNPLLEGVRWNQFTPHFNDGKPCEFNVYGPEFKFNLGAPMVSEDDDSHDDYHSEGWYEDYSVNDKFFDKRSDIINHKEVAALKKTVKDVSIVFQKLSSMETQLQDMFGDGVQITVTAEGVESEDYDHD